MAKFRGGKGRYRKNRKSHSRSMRQLTGDRM